MPLHLASVAFFGNPPISVPSLLFLPPALESQANLTGKIINSAGYGGTYYNPSYLGEAKAGSSQVQGQPGQFSETLSQIKRAGDVTQWYSVSGFNPQNRKINKQILKHQVFFF
ncbi:hypothetical protein H1C71_033124 [Ictidomys tridecemlineatus]|nr:hypothetical protein H1C71_033124 [Ictidomys tridecemlineatus]